MGCSILFPLSFTLDAFLRVFPSLGESKHAEYRTGVEKRGNSLSPVSLELFGQTRFTSLIEGRARVLHVERAGWQHRDKCTYLPEGTRCISVFLRTRTKPSLQRGYRAGQRGREPATTGLSKRDTPIYQFRNGRVIVEKWSPERHVVFHQRNYRSLRPLFPVCFRSNLSSSSTHTRKELGHERMTINEWQLLLAIFLFCRAFRQRSELQN